MPPTPATRAHLGAVAHFIADRLSTPPVAARPELARSLADGAAGIALLHIERALAGSAGWTTAHRWLTSATRPSVLASIDSSLYLGAPAVAFVVHTATTDQSERYLKAQHALDRAVTTLAHRRIGQALHRISRAAPPRNAEFDVISGLTGIGAHLLRRNPDNEALPRILDYLVRLTEPLHHDDRTLPGWWTLHDPHGTTSSAFPGGHANLGLAHGITGPLALLALAKQRGVLVPGHTDAIGYILKWLDAWRQHDNAGLWWPQWITSDEHRTGRTTQPGPRRPSWCYGTPGLARAQQLAALAIGDNTRRQLAEQALASCLADARQLVRITDPSLCHGWAGLLMTAWRSAIDATTPEIAHHLPHIAAELAGHADTTDLGDGFLEGRAGVALALHAAAHGAPPASGWDSCLMIT